MPRPSSPIVTFTGVDDDNDADRSNSSSSSVISGGPRSLGMDVKVIPPSDSPNPAARLARGFTITVSAPPDEGAVSETESVGGQSSRGGSSSALHSRQATLTTDLELLQPDEFTVEIPFNQTESRLPSLEDMLADEHLKGVLGSSEHHAEVQNAILIEDGKAKYEALMALVEKSCNDEQWRDEAARDRSLVDNVALFCRQRLTTAQNPRAPSSDSLRRSKSFRSTLSRRSLSGASTEFFPQSPKVTTGGGLMSLCQHSRSESDAQIAAINLAFVGASVKLLRNLCVDNSLCQSFVHEHRLVDFLADRVDLMVEVTSWLNRNLKELESSLKQPPWFQLEIYQLSQTVLQLAVNVMVGHSKAKQHIIEHCIPDSLLKIVLLNGNIDLIASFLQTAVVDQPSQTLVQPFLSAPLSSQLWFWSLAAYWTCTPAADTARAAAVARKKKKSQTLQAASLSASCSAIQMEPPMKPDFAASMKQQQILPTGELFRRFLASFLIREGQFHSAVGRDEEDEGSLEGEQGSTVKLPTSQLEMRSFFSLAIEALMFGQMLPGYMVWHRLQHSPSTTRRSVTSRESSRRASYDGGGASMEGEEDVWMMNSALREADKSIALKCFWSILEQVSQEEGTSNASKQTDHQSSSFATTILSQETSLKSLVNYLSVIMESFPSQNEVSLQTDLQISLPSFLEFLSSLTAIGASPGLLAKYTDTFSQPILHLLLSLLKYNIKSTLMPSILTIANLLYKNDSIKQWFIQHGGLKVIAQHARVLDTESPVAQEAAIFALRNAVEEGGAKMSGV